jgi:hypothetical protein
LENKEIEMLMEMAAEIMGSRGGTSAGAMAAIQENSDLSGRSAKGLVATVILDKVATAPECYWMDSIRGCCVNTKVLPQVYSGPDGSYFITEDTTETHQPETEYTVRQVLVTAPMQKVAVFSTLNEAKVAANLMSGL